MYAEPYYSYGEGNTAYCKECIYYHYEIRLVNSLYASDHQLQILIDNLHWKTLSVSVPGAAYILPQCIDEQGILKHYKTLCETNGDPQIGKLYRSLMKGTKVQLTSGIKYRYRIHICPTDNRDPLRKKWLGGWLSRNNDLLEERMVDLSEVIDEQIYKKLTMNPSVE